MSLLDWPRDRWGGEVCQRTTFPSLFTFHSWKFSLRSRADIQCPALDVKLIKSTRGKSCFLNSQEEKGQKPPGRNTLISPHSQQNEMCLFPSFKYWHLFLPKYSSTQSSFCVFFFLELQIIYLHCLDFWLHKYYLMLLTSIFSYLKYGKLDISSHWFLPNTSH